MLSYLSLHRSTRLLAAAAILLLPALGRGQACDLTKTLAQMDAASAKFQSAQADFSWTQYEAVIQENETPQAGTIYFARHGGTTSMAADIRTPAAKYLTFDGNEVSVYAPGPNQEQIFAAGDNKDRVETFLTLGFGGSGKDLQKSWDVTCAGTETIGTVPTVKLTLVAKQQSIRDNFSSVAIWIDPARAVSVKQVFTAPSGDIKTDLFTNIKVNAPIDAAVFKIKTKPGVQVTRK